MSAKSKEVATVTPDPFVEMVERLAANPDVDANKMEKLVDMQIKILDHLIVSPDHVFSFRQEGLL